MVAFFSIILSIITRLQEDEYYDQWDGISEPEYSSSIMQFMASNDLIFVVLGVSLIIWFTLLFFLYRLDRKVSQLEKQLEIDDSKTQSS